MITFCLEAVGPKGGDIRLVVDDENLLGRMLGLPWRLNRAAGFVNEFPDVTDLLDW